MDEMPNSWKTDDLTAQRLLFNLEALGSASAYPIELDRLPKGEPVTVRFKPHQSLRIRLAKHDFVLVSGPQFLLIDDTGPTSNWTRHAASSAAVPIVAQSSAIDIVRFRANT